VSQSEPEAERLRHLPAGAQNKEIPVVCVRALQRRTRKHGRPVFALRSVCPKLTFGSPSALVVSRPSCGPKLWPTASSGGGLLPVGANRTQKSERDAAI